MNDSEINEKIHVEIMGGKCWHTNKNEPLSLVPFCEKCGDLIGIRPPDYAENISDAFRVVEKLNPGTIALTKFRGMEWIAHFEVSDTQTVIGGDEYLPKAICLAALKTLENK